MPRQGTCGSAPGPGGGCIPAHRGYGGPIPAIVNSLLSVWVTSRGCHSRPSQLPTVPMMCCLAGETARRAQQQTRSAWQDAACTTHAPCAHSCQAARPRTAGCRAPGCRPARASCIAPRWPRGAARARPAPQSAAAAPPSPSSPALRACVARRSDSRPADRRAPRETGHAEQVPAVLLTRLPSHALVHCSNYISTAYCLTKCVVLLGAFA